MDESFPKLEIHVVVKVDRGHRLSRMLGWSVQRTRIVRPKHLSEGSAMKLLTLSSLIPLMAALHVLVAGSNASEALTLENRHMSVTIDARHGGAVVTMVHKHAVSLPIIENRGAGIAGKGRFFVPVIELGDRRFDLNEVAMRVAPGARTSDLTLTADLQELCPGLRIERRFEADEGESGFRITDRLVNDGSDTRELTLRIGATCRFDGQPWNRSLRCWFGDRQTSRWMFTPYGRGIESKYQSPTNRPFWRVIGQYGTGFLYRPVAAGESTALVHRLPEQPGNPAEFEWMGDVVKLPAEGELSVASAVLVDTGGREGNQSATLLQADRIIVHGDLPRAGRRAAPMDVFVTATSPVSRRVRVVVQERFVLLDWAQPRKETEPKEVAVFDLDLPAGIGVVRHLRHAPSHSGLMYLRFEVRDESDVVLSSTEPRAVIDGHLITEEGEFPQTWQRYVRRLPEVHLRGSWEEIGQQMARLGLIKQKEDPSHAAERLALYEERFPYYARLLHGAAAELKVEPTKLAGRRSSRPRPPEPVACMGVLVRGPDGPLHLYSKERSGSSVSGMGYVKVVPDAGYRFHMYTLGNATFGYGVNEAGLSTSGATINCDAETKQIGEEATRRRRDEGKAMAPLGMHMLLATCADVDQAIRFITDEVAPLEFTGNMLLADREGNAAILESVGTYQQIVRCDPQQPVSTMGNYPHRRDDGRFNIGENWGWTANTMLRERFVKSLARERRDQLRLDDAFMLMATRAEPGGMCQHIFDNVGTLYSTCSSIAVPRTGDLYISDGPPSQVEYVRYRLGDPARAPKQ